MPDFRREIKGEPLNSFWKLRTKVATVAVFAVATISLFVGWLRMKDAPTAPRKLYFENLSIEIEQPPKTIFEPQFMQGAIRIITGNATKLGFGPCPASSSCQFEDATAVSLRSSDNLNALGLSNFTWTHGACSKLQLGFMNRNAGSEIHLLQGNPACAVTMNLLLEDATLPQLSFNAGTKSPNLDLSPNARIVWSTTGSVTVSAKPTSGVMLPPDMLPHIRSVTGKLAKPLAPVAGARSRIVCSADAGQTVVLTRGAWNFEQVSMQEAQMTIDVEPSGKGLVLCAGTFDVAGVAPCPKTDDACALDADEFLRRTSEVFSLLAGLLGFLLAIVGFNGGKPCNSGSGTSVTSPEQATTVEIEKQNVKPELAIEDRSKDSESSKHGEQ
jgi:hypothetical protein